MIEVALTLALVAARTPPPGCHLQIIPDYTVIFAYRAALRLSPQCEFTQTLRIRKSSTTSTRRGGAPYQPIQPETGAWTLGRLSSNVPGRQLWTSNSWRWEYSDPVLTKGKWRAGEVLYARP